MTRQQACVSSGIVRVRVTSAKRQGWMSFWYRLRPRVCFFGHHHTRVDAEVSGVRCIGLNKVAMPGNLVAIDMGPGKPDFALLGEYAPRYEIPRAVR